MIKLIATDLDGTFLDKNGAFDKERFGKLLDKLVEKQITFVAASGRSLLNLKKQFADYADKLGFVAENGSVVTYQDKVLFEAPLTKEQYLELAKLTCENPYGMGKDFLLSGEAGAYILEGANPEYVEKASHYYENIHIVPDFTEIDDVIFNLATDFKPDKMAKGLAFLDQYAPYSRSVTTGFSSVDIMLKDVHKALGLEHLCQILDIKPEEVVAFGDNLNDFEMLEFTGLSVVPSNAREEIKALADEVTGHAHDGAILAYMEKVVDNDN